MFTKIQIIFENLIFIKITMSKHILVKSSLIIAIILSLSSFSLVLAENFNKRSINLAGLVVDGGTLLPVEGAKIYDAQGNALGTTDKNGYYNITINYTKSGEMYFQVKIVKQGFQRFVQHEHWGNLGDTKNIMYFGLKALHSNIKSFATFADGPLNNDALGYDNVLHQFSKVKEQKAFNDKLSNAKSGNEDVFVRIDDQLYIADNTGWIHINSEKDLISINDQQMLTADKLNSRIKRKDIKGMTPLDKKEAKFAVYTKSTPPN